MQKQTVAQLLLTAAAASGTIISDVDILHYGQAGLDFSFRVEWESAGDNGTARASAIDLWMLTKQADPSSWFETVIEEGVGNTGTLWAETGDAWSTQGSWDPTLSGKALVCIYDRDDYSNEACSEELPILPAAEAPVLPPGIGIFNVSLPQVDQCGLNLSFSVTWTEGREGGDTNDGTVREVDIWFTALQPHPSTLTQIPVLQDEEEPGLANVHLGTDWAAFGWDETRGGQMMACVYNALDYRSRNCSAYMELEAAVDAGPSATQVPMGDSISEDSLGDQESSGASGAVSPMLTTVYVMVGVLGVAVISWLVFSKWRNRQMRTWLGSAEEAESLPDDDVVLFDEPNHLYSRF